MTAFEPILNNKDYTLFEFCRNRSESTKFEFMLNGLGIQLLGTKIYGSDESFYIEFIEQGWTDRLDLNLAMKRQALHCHKYHFHFADGTVTFEAPLAEDMDLFCQENLGMDFSLYI